MGRTTRKVTARSLESGGAAGHPQELPVSQGNSLYPVTDFLHFPSHPKESPSDVQFLRHTVSLYVAQAAPDFEALLCLRLLSAGIACVPPLPGWGIWIGVEDSCPAAPSAWGRGRHPTDQLRPKLERGEGAAGEQVYRSPRLAAKASLGRKVVDRPWVWSAFPPGSHGCNLQLLSKPTYPSLSLTLSRGGVGWGGGCSACCHREQLSGIRPTCTSFKTVSSLSRKAGQLAMELMETLLSPALCRWTGITDRAYTWI